MNIESIRTCVNGVKIHIIHYTPVHNRRLLHGHTLMMDVCVEGDLTNNYWIIDFEELKALVDNVVGKYNYAVIARKSDQGSIVLRGPFNVRIEYVDSEATAEVIASEVCNEILNSLINKVNARRVTVRMYEDSDRSVITTCGTG